MYGGGVALYIHQNIQFEPKRELMCDEIESLSVQIKNGKFKPFIVTSIYRPPGKPDHQANQSATSMNWNLCLACLKHKIKNPLS